MLVKANRSILLIIDVQTKLAPAVDQANACLSRCHMLLEAARRLNVPVLVTEHCPTSVGPTVPSLRDRLDADEILEKRHFDGAAEDAVERALSTYRGRSLIVAGMEAHVCVLQTALGLKAKGHRPVLVADAVASRRPSSKDLAIARMRGHGVDVVDTEMVLFEWLEVAGTAAFKDILPMIKTGVTED